MWPSYELQQQQPNSFYNNYGRWFRWLKTPRLCVQHGPTGALNYNSYNKSARTKYEVYRTRTQTFRACVTRAANTNVRNRRKHDDGYKKLEQQQLFSLTAHVLWWQICFTNFTTVADAVLLLSRLLRAKVRCKKVPTSLWDYTHEMRVDCA